MKHIIIISILLLAWNLSAQNTTKTESYLNQPNAKEQSIALNFGLLDYSTLTTELSYKKGISIFNKNFIIGSDLAIPVFTPDFSDMRFRLVTLQTNIFSRGMFDLSIKYAPTIVLAKNEIKKSTALGNDLSLITGLYGKKWGIVFTVLGDLKYVTYVEHSDYYKEVVYADVYDGWLKSPASNLRISLKGIWKLGNFETNLDLGYAQSFNSSYMLFPPFFITLGVNYVF